jgi:hypothetical protein
MKKTIITVFACLVLFGFTLTGAFAQTWTWQYAPVTSPSGIIKLTINPATNDLYGLSGDAVAAVVLGEVGTEATPLQNPAVTGFIDLAFGYQGTVYAITSNSVASCVPGDDCSLIDAQPDVPTETSGTFIDIAAGKNGKLFILYDDGEAQYILTGNPPSTLVTADVKVTPRSLNLGSNGRWVTCRISNLSGDFTIGNIDRDTVCITAINGVDLTTTVCRDPSSPSSSNGSLMIKFLRSDLISAIPTDATSVEITVTGSGVTEGGESFEFTDTDTIKTKPAKNKGPK